MNMNRREEGLTGELTRRYVTSSLAGLGCGRPVFYAVILPALILHVSIIFHFCGVKCDNNGS